MATVTTTTPYRLIYELGNAFATQLDLDLLLELVTQKCREALEAEGVAILLIDPQRDELYFPYLANLDPEVARRLASCVFPPHSGSPEKRLQGAGRSKWTTSLTRNVSTH